MEENRNRQGMEKKVNRDTFKRSVLALAVTPFSGAFTYFVFWFFLSVFYAVQFEIGGMASEIGLWVTILLPPFIACAVVTFVQGFLIKRWGMLSGALTAFFASVPLFFHFGPVLILVFAGGVIGGYFGERLAKRPDSDLVPSKVHLWRKGILVILAVLCFSSVAWILFRYLLGYISMIWGLAGSLIKPMSPPSHLPTVECSAISIFIACFVTGFGLGFLLKYWGMLYGFFIGGVSSMLISETHRGAILNFYIGYPLVLIPVLFIPALVGGVVGGYLGERIGKRRKMSFKSLGKGFRKILTNKTLLFGCLAVLILCIFVLIFWVCISKPRATKPKPGPRGTVTLQSDYPRRAVGGYNRPVLADLDGDRVPELVISGGFVTDFPFPINRGDVCIRRGDGSILPGWPKRISSAPEGYPAVGDIDGDGRPEIVLGAGSRVCAWTAKGEDLQGWPVSLSEGYIKTSPVLAELDGKKGLEVVIAAEDRVYVFDAGGGLVAGWPQAIEGYPLLIAAGDLDGDGHADIVASTEKKIYAWKRTGKLLNGWPVSIPGGGLALGDINGDGYLEVVVAGGNKQVFALRRDGKVLLGWPKNVDPKAYGIASSPALADLDGDGKLEVIVGSCYPDNHVYVWHADGKPLRGWPVTLAGPRPSVSCSPVIADIDGDNTLEVVAGTEDGRVFAWNPDGSVVTGWPQYIPGITSASLAGPVISGGIAVGDIDGDRALEVVVSKDYIWDCGEGSFGPDTKLPWPMFAHDAQHTGCYK